MPGEGLHAQSSRSKAGESSIPKKSDQGIIRYNAGEAEKIRLLFDYYHHSLPSTKVGNHIVTGSWVDDNGRYGWDDFVHTNTFDPVFVALESDFKISMMRQAFSKKVLSEADAVVIINPDNPSIVPEARLLSDEEITALREFVNDGGSLMVMVNAGGNDRAAEGFETAQLRKLVRSFGLDWNNDDTHYSDNLLYAGHPNFYDVPLFHYGAGCTLEILPGASQPEVLLNVYSDAGYPDRKVRGAGIVMVRPGQGKFILVGDVGSWTGNMARPWADNRTILRQLFQYMKPNRGVVSPQFKKGQTLDYEVTVAGLQAIPVANSLSRIQKAHYKFFSPRKITNMPYLEASARVTLTCENQSYDSGARMKASIDRFQWFADGTKSQELNTVTFTASRQGKVSGADAHGEHGHWLAADIPALVALVPVDGLRPGDRWRSREYLRVPILRGTDTPPVKPYEVEVVYVEDADVEGESCRLLRSSGEVWLDEVGIAIEDLLPAEEIQRVGGSHYSFFREHGGKLLFKKEQWVDASTGIVRKARLQYRIVAWIDDDRKPDFVSNAEKDNNMIVSLAHVVNFRLK